MSHTQIQTALQKLANPEKAVFLQRFFKTAKGQYAEGDIFMGLTVPQTRTVVAQFKDEPLKELEKLLHSKKHEERLCALLIMVDQAKRLLKKRAQNEKKLTDIYNTYLQNTKWINNWDLVDCSASYIVGPYLENSSREKLVELAHSKDLWEKRIAVIATLYYISKGESKTTFKIADILITDTHDLIHKAVGWMLREVGKKCSRKELEEYLQPRYKTMPRTMLRYAIEHFSSETRQKYLKGQI